MFQALRRWLSLGPLGARSSGFSAVEAWAGRAGFRFRKAQDRSRFLIETTSNGCELRMEWGPSQRSYIEPSELRLRMDMNLPGSVQMLVLNQALMERLEGETFERYTQSAQTMIDISTPEEMRWLAMFPKVDLSFDKPLRSHFCVLGADPDLTLAWVKAGLAPQLERASQSLLRGDTPFVLITMRGKMYLRMQLAEPSPAALTQCLELFDSAVLAAQSLIGQMPQGHTEWPSTANTAWQQLDDPEDPLRR